MEKFEKLMARNIYSVKWCGGGEAGGKRRHSALNWTCLGLYRQGNRDLDPDMLR